MIKLQNNVVVDKNKKNMGTINKKNMGTINKKSSFAATKKAALMPTAFLLPHSPDLSLLIGLLSCIA